MTPKDLQFGSEDTGAVLRRHRIETLGRGLREMAALLDIAPPHLTDIEKGRRSPSEDLLMRIARVYGLDEAMLRAGWKKPQGVVREIASQDATAAEKVPELLRSARSLNAQQWDQLIAQARTLAARSKRTPKRKKKPT